METAPLHTETRAHGTYQIEHHGAGVHALLFKTTRQRKFQYIGTFSSLESAKRGMEHHTLTGWSKAIKLTGCPEIHPDAKWLRK